MTDAGDNAPAGSALARSPTARPGARCDAPTQEIAAAVRSDVPASSQVRGDRQDLPGAPRWPPMPRRRPSGPRPRRPGRARRPSGRPQGGGAPAPPDQPGQAAADPRRPLVGDQDRVPAVDRLRRDVRGRRLPGLLDHGRFGSVGPGQRDDPAGGQPGPQGRQFNIKDYVAMSRVMGITMLISVIDVVLITALATLGAFIYNMSAAMLGRHRGHPGRRPRLR